MTGETPTVISQRSIAGGPRFHFHDGHLAYFGFEWDFKAKYEGIAGPSQYRRSTTQDWLLKIAWVYLLLLALMLLVRDHGPHYGAEGLQRLLWSAGGFACIAAPICGALYYLTHMEFTVIPTRNGNILVVRDKEHDAIIAKLQAERLESLRRLSAPDPAYSPPEELAKLKWLQDEGAITADEYTRLSAQVAA